MQEQQFLHILENEKWEVVMSTRERFILNGVEHRALKGVMNSYKFAEFKNFTINVSHIVSISCIAQGLPRLIKPNVPEISDEQRQKNIEKLAEIKSNILNKEEK